MTHTCLIKCVLSFRFLEAEGYEETAKFTQKQLVKAVDITSATKHFELNLEFGPYRYKLFQ